MSDDIVDLFADDGNSQSQEIRYRQGEILTFDQVTLANTVKMGNAILNNVSLLGVGETTLLVPGAKVGLHLVGNGSMKSIYIIGRLVKPNTADAIDATSLLNSQIFADQVFGIETCTSSTFTDLATVGPAVTVSVGSSGRLLIIATAQIHLTPSAFVNTAVGRGDLGLAMGGANVRVPDIAVDPLLPLLIDQLEFSPSGTPQIGRTIVATVTGQAVYSGLNPGLTTLRLQYRKSAVAGAVDPGFARRTLTVIKL